MYNLCLNKVLDKLTVDLNVFIAKYTKNFAFENVIYWINILQRLSFGKPNTGGDDEFIQLIEAYNK